jgi:hypothetical protein
VSEQFCPDTAQPARLECSMGRRLSNSRSTLPSELAFRMSAIVTRRRSPLASGGNAPHVWKMTQKEHHQADARQDAAAVARWDDEGGAMPRPFADKTDGKVSKNGLSKPRARCRAR